MELFIETLTGTAFELRVSPFETILSVKAKIQRLEGIPISQQHLIWQSMELEDDYCLHDYSIQDGATLKLVLAMRGGPINTRRVPMDDPALREMAEYMESNRDEILDKLPGNRQVTLLVYREGDQLNFFRVVDRGDGTLTPLSESLSGASVYNLYDDEEDEGSAGNDNLEENVRMKEKMRLLRSKMENLTVTKKPKKKLPHPPSGRPKSRSRHHRHLASSAGKTKHHTGPYTLLPKNYPLPPVNNQCNRTYPPPAPGLRLPSVTDNKIAQDENIAAYANQIETEREGVKSADRNSKLSQASISPGANSPGTPLISAPGLEHGSSAAMLSRPKMSNNRKSQEDLEALMLKRQIQSPQVAKQRTNLYVNSNNTDSSAVAKDNTRRPVTSSRKRETPALQTVKESQPLLNHPATPSKLTTKRMDSIPSERSSSRQHGGKISPTYKDSSQGGRPHTSTRHKQGQGLLLESLTSQEARGLLRQTSLERLGSSKISSYVHSASKSRSGYNYNGERIYTPEGTRVSARLRRSAGRDGCLSPRLPPVKHKKKHSKRCYICAKKTGLATSYQCRCGNNFCASHRYAETHGCTFDYKSEGRKLLQQNNPVISAPKLPKI